MQTLRAPHCLVVSISLLLASVSALPQSQDAATERDQLANQRIRVEAALRARDEEQRAALENDAESAADDGNAPDLVANPGNTRAVLSNATPPTASSAPQSRDDASLSQALDQLQRLGQLKDAGYVTDAEFEQIKRRILEQNF